ncbi:MAG: dTDP-4-dehydrorhamnose reductase [Flavobacteriales bacterium]
MTNNNNTYKIAVLGANGQLGQEFQHIASEYPELQFHFYGKNECSLSDKDQMHEVIGSLQPDYVINAGAYTNVEKAEEEKDLNDLINHRGAGYLAAVCKEVGATLFHISTDYVFDGKKTTPYSESDDTHPLNQYGLAKRKGELAIEKIGGNYFVLRTSWLYSTFGHNFFKTMLKLSETRDQLKVVNDQIATPTYARTLARDINRMIIRLNTENIPSGIFHYTQQGEASWFDFASEIMLLAERNTKVEPCSSSEFPQVAERPAYSKLDTTKFETQFFAVPHWKEALKNCINDLAQ